MISIEGVNWSTDFSVLNERLDDNVIIHFHKYWNSPTVETIKEFLDKRDQLNHPLYMGEGGENDLYWYAAAFKMYDQLDISWNFWTYKKIDNNNSIISFKKPIVRSIVVNKKEGPLKIKMFFAPVSMSFFAASEPPLTLSEVIDGIFSSRM